MLGITRERVYVLVGEGRLNAKRHGRRVLVEQAGVRARAAAPRRGKRPPVTAPDGWMLPAEAARLLG
jgi:hypothetical protein